MGQIDEALGGSSKIKYRICTACHEPIEAHRLEVDPRSKWCAECMEYRKILGSRKFSKLD
jgi:RNA polymerase-binding transcription factor DksA